MFLSIFPQILFLAPAGTGLLRVAAAICFGYMAWQLLARQDQITGISFPLIGRPRAWMLQVSFAALATMAILLFLGVWTQLIALLGVVAILKHIIFYKKYGELFAFPLSTNLLLLCICLMLVVTGAGSLAFDMPL